MSYSITDMGRSTKSQAKQSLNTLAELETRREIANDQIKQQDKSAKMSGVATGAAMGFMMGGPAGAVIGASIGFIGGSI